MDPRRVLVTGALGNVGAAVVEALRERSVAFRVADRQPARVNERFGQVDVEDGAEIDAVAFDFGDPQTFRPALEGVDAVFLIRPPAIARVGPTINRFIDAAESAGVEHVVFASVAGAETNRIVPHHRIEQHLRSTSMASTMLRPGFFAQNIGGAYQRDIVADDRVYVPAGDGEVAFVDARDLGEAAAVILCDPTLRGRSFHVTGPSTYTFVDVAEMLSDLTGRDIRYEPASVLGYLRHLRGQGMPIVQCVVQTVLHVGLRGGDAEEITDELPRLLGRNPRNLDDYLRDHAALWTPDKPD